MMTIREFLTLTCQWLIAECKTGKIKEAIEKFKSIINITEEEAKRWWRRAKWLTLRATAASFVIFLTGALIGGYYNLGWPNSVAGLLIAPILFILLAWWTPLVAIVAVIYEIAHKGIGDLTEVALAQAKWWLGIVSGILLWQVLVSLLFTYVPYWNKPSSIPVLALLSLALVLISIRWGGIRFYRWVIKSLVIIAFCLQIAVFYLPDTSTELNSSAGRIDKYTANILKNGFTSKRQVQEKIATFKPNEPTNTGLIAQMGDTVKYINPTATFKVPGKEKFHLISITTEHESTGSGSIVIYGSEKEGYVQIVVIPKEI